jgi:8-hydroxy-5-deazaflavin:NADPH oxidoreductase
MIKTPKIAIIGGTGDLGSGLAKGWSKNGYPVVLGSRSADKAIETAAALRNEGFERIEGAANSEAAAQGDVIVVTVPFANLVGSLAEIYSAAAEKIVVSAVVPLVPPAVSTVQLPLEGSAAAIIKANLPETAKVAAAFQNVGSTKLHSGAKAECDVLVFCDDEAARAQVIDLANAVANRGVDGGKLANAVAAEALTSVLIAINRKYKVKGAGIQITGLSD